MNRIGLVMLLAGLSTAAAGQDPGRIRVEVRAGGEPVAGATVVVADATRVTDAAGRSTRGRPWMGASPMAGSASSSSQLLLDTGKKMSVRHFAGSGSAPGSVT